MLQESDITWLFNHHHQGRYTNGQQVHEKVLNTLIVSEVQIKITVRYLLKPVRLYWYITKKTGDKNKSRQRCGKKKTLVHCWWEYKMVWPSRKTMWRFLKKLKLGQPYKPAIPVLSKYSKETKSLSWKVSRMEWRGQTSQERTLAPFKQEVMG